ncbi:MAG: SUMF1/EgtB/PvdO family nonheme iron enzyme [Roseiarcus sp.]|jgi:formylglycine-generating enzyme required for sulfatase activity
MLDPVGFWSYARLDDEQSDGRLSELREIVGKAIGLKLGDKVTLWQDVPAIPFGADWAETIERAIGQTTFFIPIVTPRFLKSVNCRDEFLSFRRRMQRLGRNDLIFPVHYVGVDGVRPEETVFGDDLATLKRSQWIDFQPLLDVDPKSQEVRRWASKLAGSVVNALRRPEAATVPERATSRDAPTDPAPGRPSRKGLLIVGIVTLVGVVAASLGLIAMRGRSGLAPSPTQTPMVIASASPAPTPAPAISAAPLPIPPPVVPASPSPTPTPTSAASLVNSGACDGSGAALASPASRTPGVLSGAEECALKPKDAFRECADCPAMVVLPSGSFTMGSPASEPGRLDDEGPQHEVTIAKPFAVGEFAVTVDEFKAFVAATAYDAVSACYAWNGWSWQLQSDRSWRTPGFEQTGSHPVVCVNSNDAQAYAKWLSGKTGESYRLLTEDEWEYAARAGTTTAHYWGDAIGKGNANCNGCSSQWDNKETSPVGSFKPNGFGLYDMAGNVWQWVQDCYNGGYSGAPSDGSAWTTGDCSAHVVRGGSWLSGPLMLRAAGRSWDATDVRSNGLGFRVARTLRP